jgi:hypothetical protein
MRKGRRWFGSLAALVLVVCAVIPVSAWGMLALWYRLPGPAPLRLMAAVAFAATGILAAVCLFGRRPLVAGLPFLVAFAALIAWWGTIEPAAQARWAPDVSRQTRGKLDGDVLTLTDMRNFTWRSDDSFDEAWVTRSFDLTTLRTLDLVMSYWAGPEMAHVIMSFGFEGGRQLAWSIEVRRREGGEFSPLADLFKSNPLIVVAADERDVVRVRSNVRGEDVRIYRLRTPPAVARALLLEYVADANALAEKPAFYNSLTTNCTTSIVRLVRAAGRQVPADWRLIVNGYLPGYLYDSGAVDTRLPLSELTERGRIVARAEAAGDSPDFSTLIRAGVPSPF